MKHLIKSNISSCNCNPSWHMITNNCMSHSNHRISQRHDFGAFCHMYVKFPMIKRLFYCYEYFIRDNFILKDSLLPLSSPISLSHSSPLSPILPLSLSHSSSLSLSHSSSLALLSLTQLMYFSSDCKFVSQDSSVEER